MMLQICVSAFLSSHISQVFLSKLLAKLDGNTCSNITSFTTLNTSKKFERKKKFVILQRFRTSLLFTTLIWREKLQKLFSWKCNGFTVLYCLQLWFDEKNCKNFPQFFPNSSISDLLDFPTIFSIFLAFKMNDRTWLVRWYSLLLQPTWKSNLRRTWANTRWWRSFVSPKESVS